MEAAKEDAKKKKLGEDTLSLTLFPYAVPENKSDPEYNQLKEERLKVLDVSCKSGIDRHKRMISVWKGDKKLEEIDANLG